MAFSGLLLLTLLALRTLLLIALTLLDLLFLLALTALHLLFLNPLAAFGTLDIALALLTLDLLRPFTLGTLYGAPFYARLAAFCPGLAPLHAGSGSLRGRPRGLAGCTSAAAAATPALITILRLGEAGSAGTEQQYPGCCRNHFPVHLVTLP